MHADQVERDRRERPQVTEVGARAAPCPRSQQPTVEQVVRHGTNAITAAGARLWPDQLVRLADHVPSVTGYVRRVRVGERELYAKTSILGVSLVSILRGKHGTWAEVQAAQRLYAYDPHNLLVREAHQLRFLTELGQPRAVAAHWGRHRAWARPRRDCARRARSARRAPGPSMGRAQPPPPGRPGQMRRVDQRARHHLYLDPEVW